MHGGLGILAGDYLKSACDLGLLYVGIGIRLATGVHSADDRTGRQAVRRLSMLFL